jgi:4-hydroxybenzoate polyprenyltransferase
MRLARRTHAAAVVLFLLFWLFSGLGFLSLLGVLAVAMLMRHQHRLVSPTDLSRIDAAFFTTNGVISIGLFVIVAVDVLLC